MNKYSVCGTRMRVVLLIAAVVLALGAPEPAHGQTPPAPAAKNIVNNGGFEAGQPEDNLWDGVDSGGFLAGEKEKVPVLTLAGTLAETTMPVSVSVADMNADGLLDIAMMDVLGYLKIFFNSGTPQEPRYTTGEMAGVYLARIASKDPILEGVNAPKARWATRGYLTDMLKSGKKDLIVGNYFGEVFMVPNEGTVQKPDFRQPADIARLLIPTMKDPMRKWGNVFSPATWDWDKDGKEDLLLGEGSYSANNIHLLLNVGPNNLKPVFDETYRHVLAFGDGREQLAPCVVDYNSDGFPDLLVTDRSGEVSLYLNPGKPWNSKTEPLPEIKFTSTVAGANGAPLKFGDISTITTADLNGDTLFDIIVGKTNGRLALVLNTGTKLEPKFGAPVEIKGEGDTKPFSLPTNWDVDYGLLRGNYYGFVSVVKAAEDPAALPAEGQSCLKVGYVPSPNKIMSPPAIYTGALGDTNADRPRFSGTSEQNMSLAAARSFMLRQIGRFRFKTNTSYTLSFKVKGRFTDGIAVVGWQAEKKVGRGAETDRGSVSAKAEPDDIGFAVVKFSGAAAWTEVKTDFKVSFKAPWAKDLKEAMESVLQITLAMPQGGEAYFDDVKIVEKQ